MIRDYLLKRENLMTVFVLVDVRTNLRRSMWNSSTGWANREYRSALFLPKRTNSPNNRSSVPLNPTKGRCGQPGKNSRCYLSPPAQMRNGREEILDYILSVAADFKPSRKP